VRRVNEETAALKEAVLLDEETAKKTRQEMEKFQEMSQAVLARDVPAEIVNYESRVNALLIQLPVLRSGGVLPFCLFLFLPRPKSW